MCVVCVCECVCACVRVHVRVCICASMCKCHVTCKHTYCVCKWVCCVCQVMQFYVGTSVLNNITLVFQTTKPSKLLG